MRRVLFRLVRLLWRACIRTIARVSLVLVAFMWPYRTCSVVITGVFFVVQVTLTHMRHTQGPRANQAREWNICGSWDEI